jgi:hypothetical protein
MMHSRLALPAAMALTLTLTACGGDAIAAAVPAKPGQDNRPALQAAIDRLAAAGGGTLQLENGSYDVNGPIYVRSGVTIAGRGRGTIITNEKFRQGTGWGGITVFAGNLNPGSFSNALNEGYPPRPTRRVSDRELTIDNCNAREVAGITGRVVWLSTELSEPGRRGRPNPRYGEMSLAERVDGCRVRLADPISAPANVPVRIHWSDGSRALPLDEPNVPIRDAGMRDLQLASPNGQALLVSGCYKCNFTNLHIGRSRRLFTLQGMRHGQYRNITGNFTERGIEVVQYATQNVVDGVDAQFLRAGNEATRPAIRFGEYARDNIVRNVRLRLGEAYIGRDKIRFDESAGNRLMNIKLMMPRGDRSRSVVYLAPNATRVDERQLPPGTSLQGVELCFGGNGTACEPIG